MNEILRPVMTLQRTTKLVFFMENAMIITDLKLASVKNSLMKKEASGVRFQDFIVCVLAFQHERDDGGWKEASIMACGLKI